MKYLIFTILIAFTKLGYTQQSCQNFGKVKTIMESADLKHQGTLKQIRLYWSKRCTCESGSRTGGDWQYTITVANRVFDNYNAGILTKNYSGPNFPKPNRKLTVNDCGNDSENPQLYPDISDCKTNTFTKEQDPQQYANQYMLDRCECLNGVPNEERAKQLIAQMKINKNNCNTYYGSSFNLPYLVKWDECKIIAHGDLNKSASSYSDTNAELKSAAASLMNQLASSTDNVKIKQISQNLNDSREWVGIFKQADPANSEAFDKIENYAMAGAFVAGLFKKDKKNDTPKSTYWIDGAWKELTDAQVEQMGLKILKEPFKNGELAQVNSEISKKIGLDLLFEKRFEVFQEMINKLESVNNDKIKGLRIKIYLSSIEKEYDKRDNYWIQLYEEFLPLRDNSDLYDEMNRLTIQIRKNLIISHSIMREVVIQSYTNSNPDLNWDEIKTLKQEINKAGYIDLTFFHYIDNDATEYSIMNDNLVPFGHHKNAITEAIEPALNVFGMNQGYANEENSVLKKYSSEGVQIHTKKNIELLPSSIYMGSLIGYALGYRGFIYENLSLGSPVNSKDGLSYYNIDKQQNTLQYQYYELIKSDSNFLALVNSEYYNLYDNYIYLYNRKHNINNETNKDAFIDYNKNQIELYGKNLESVSLKLNSWIDIAPKYLKARPKKQMEYLKNYAYVGLYEYINVQVAENDMSSYSLNISHLEILNNLISISDALNFEGVPRILDQARSNTLGAYAINYPNASPPIIRFSRLKLMRYYLEKKNSIDTHINEDAIYIKQNLFYVLEDFIRSEGNHEIARFVIEDLKLNE